MFTSPGEILISIGPLKVYYYGLVIALSIFIGIFVSDFIRKRFYPCISQLDYFDTIFVVVICGLIGARLYYCILNLSYYAENPIEIFAIRQGGMSIHGALIAGFFGGVIFACLKKLPVLKLCDICAYGLVLAQAVGRWGNFFNSEAFGHPTDIFCKLYIPISHRPVRYLNYEYFHPAFLYESILCIVIFILLFFVIRKFVKNYTGLIFCSYLILYSIARILVESIRVDSIMNIYGIAFPIIASIGIILLAAVAVFIIIKTQKTN